MSGWAKLTDKAPPKRMLCDFLYKEDDGYIWMLCSAFPIDLYAFEGPMYWRPADLLPADVEE
jgi:hypothetical protein